MSPNLQCDNNHPPFRPQRGPLASHAAMAMIEHTMTLEPLRFRPVLKRCLSGGRRLGTMLGKPLIDDGPHAESWEVVAHGDDQSVVLDGPFAGSTLHDLVVRQGPALFGRHDPQPQFPL